MVTKPLHEIKNFGSNFMLSALISQIGNQHCAEVRMLRIADDFTSDKKATIWICKVCIQQSNGQVPIQISTNQED